MSTKMTNKTETAILSAKAALTTCRAMGKKIKGDFDNCVIKENKTNFGTVVEIENSHFLYTIKFDKFGMVISEQLNAFETVLGFFDTAFHPVYVSEYTYLDGFKSEVL